MGVCRARDEDGQQGDPEATSPPSEFWTLSCTWLLGKTGLKGRPLCGPHNADSTALALSFWEQILLGSLTQALWCRGRREGAQARPECVCLSASQPALAKPEALLVFPGQVAQLSCTISPHYAIVGDLGVSWYQQRAGSAPRLLLYYRSEEDQHRAPGTPDRFSAAADAAHNTCVLTISPVQPEDDADYYCFVGELF